MTAPMSMAEDVRHASPGVRLDLLALGAIALAALGLRLIRLGGPSLWYDEAVTMRLARQANPAALVRLLFEIDASRAPLHPILLQGWLAVFGTSDLAGRAFSVACGVFTVVLVYRLGRAAYDEPTGRWAAWLCALSPLLIHYSQEVRMYAWQVLATCLSWSILLSFRHDATLGKRAAYVLSLVALVYTHPLGCFMVAAHGVATLANRPAFRLSWRQWLAIQLAVGLAIIPWLGRYMDHPPESSFGRPALRSLIGLGVFFTGGNGLTQVAWLGLIVVGLLTLHRGPGDRPERDDVHSGRRLGLDHPVEATTLLVWLVVPPLLLFAYSWVSHPVFGPQKYNLHVAPAYLLLAARGLMKLARPTRFAIALAGAALAGVAIVHHHSLPPDRFREAAEVVETVDRHSTVVVYCEDKQRVLVRSVPFHYYLDYFRDPQSKVNVISSRAALDQLRRDPRAIGTTIWYVAPTVDGKDELPVPPALDALYEPDRSYAFPKFRLSHCRLRVRGRGEASTAPSREGSRRGRLRLPSC